MSDVNVTLNTDALAPLTKAVGDIDAKIGKLDDKFITKDEAQVLQKSILDLKAELAEIKVRDIGDELGIGLRYKSLDNLKNDRQAYGFGCAFIAAMANDVPKMVNGPIVQKALEYAQSRRFLLEKTTQIEGTNTLGGYLVNDEFSNTMIDLREQYGVSRQLALVEPMRSDTKSFNRRTGGLTVYGLSEAGSFTESNLTWDRVSLVAKKWGTLTRVSSELSEDAIINLGDTLAGEIAYAFAEKEDDCYLNGDGSSTYQGMTGIRTKLKNVNGVDEGGGLILQTGNDFAAITLADFHRLIGILPQYADNMNTKFVCHRTFWSQVMCRLAYATGGTSKQDVATAGSKTFLGYPVVISQKMPSSDTASVVYCTFGDHKAASTIGNRRGTTIAFSEHKYFDTDEIAVRGTTRWDINVHDVGTATAAGPVVGLMSSAS